MMKKPNTKSRMNYNIPGVGNIYIIKQVRRPGVLRVVIITLHDESIIKALVM